MHHSINICLHWRCLIEKFSLWGGGVISCCSPSHEQRGGTLKVIPGASSWYQALRAVHCTIPISTPNKPLPTRPHTC